MLCVLVADDEPDVRFLLRLLLEQRGHEVHEASDGVEALEVAAEVDGDLDLVVTDLHMPRLDGAALVTALAERLPDLPVLLWTTQYGELPHGAVAKAPMEFDPEAVIEWLAARSER